MALHQRNTHPEFVEGCFQCRLTTVGISATALPTRKPEPLKVDTKEAHWSRDMDSYKRLRSEGHQPRQIDGCADLEMRAEHPEHIELGRTDVTASQIDQAEQILRRRVTQPQTTMGWEQS